MSWNEAVPKIHHVREGEGESLIRVIAGEYLGHKAPSAPPNSYGSMDESDILILTIEMTGACRVILPPQSQNDNSGSLHRGSYTGHGQS